MIGGCSSKSAIFPLKRSKYQYSIHQMKDIIFLYLLTYLNLRINVKIENGIWKCIFLTYFLVVHISISNVLYGLKVSVHVSDIRFEGNVSQILILGLTFYFMQKNG